MFLLSRCFQGCGGLVLCGSSALFVPLVGLSRSCGVCDGEVNHYYHMPEDQSKRHTTNVHSAVHKQRDVDLGRCDAAAYFFVRLGVKCFDSSVLVFCELLCAFIQIYLPPAGAG